MLHRARILLQVGRPLLGEARGRLTIYVALFILTQAAIPLYLPILLGRFATVAYQHANPARPVHWASPLRSYLLWLLLSIALVPLLIWFKASQTRLDNAMESSLRDRLFRTVLMLPTASIGERTPAELTNILSQSTTETEMAIRGLAVDPPLQLLSLIAATYFVLGQLKLGGLPHRWLLLAFLVITGLGLFSALVVWKTGTVRIGENQRRTQEQRFKLLGLINAAMASPEEIQILNANEIFSAKHREGLLLIMKLKLRQVFALETINSVIGLPTLITLATLYALLLRSAGSARSFADPGIFISLALLTPQALLPFRTIAGLTVSAGAAWPSLETVYSLLHSPMAAKERPGATDILISEPSLSLRDVCFSYSPTQHILNGVTCAVMQGSITALVGRMGQGKTTLFRLVLGALEPDSGVIAIGGNRTSSLTLESLRRQLALMPQNPTFFHDSVLENFRIAKADASREEIRSLCERCRLWPILVERFGADPLSALFNPTTSLSPGQRKLFALARTLLRNPRILLLDEPTANLDSHEKLLLLQTLRPACQGRTVLVIDHDLVWLRALCDQFIVLDQGRVAQHGAPDALLVQPGPFRELFSDNSFSAAESDFRG
jgi:ABC-type multidrug transport system fused ATPase/permease subunit